MSPGPQPAGWPADRASHTALGEQQRPPDAASRSRADAARPAPRPAGRRSAAGRLHASCDAVGPAGGGAVRVLCTKHYEWDGGASVMVAHATELYKPGSPVTGPVTGPVTVVGGIGRWQGAHGEDLEFKFDPKTGRGGGKIVLYCLDGRC